MQHKSINFYDWRLDSGENIDIWYKKSVEEAIQISNEIKNYKYPIIITWTLYKTTKQYSGYEIDKMVLRDKKSIFYHLINN